MTLKQFSCFVARETFHLVCLLREDWIITRGNLIWVWHKRSVCPSVTILLPGEDLSPPKTYSVVLSPPLPSLSSHPPSPTPTQRALYPPQPWWALSPQPSFLFEKSLTKLLRLALNILCSPGRSWTWDLPFLVSRVSRITGHCFSFY